MTLIIISGICLSAACGFRIFIPFLILSIFSYTGNIELNEGALWISTIPALIIFSSLTVLEIIGYYIPWIDNMLDLISTPLSIIAGIIILSSLLIDVNPAIKWIFSILFGGVISFNVQLMTVKARALTSVFESGFGNSVFSTIELIAALLISVLAIFQPVISLAILLLLTYLIFRKIILKRKTDLQKG